MGLGDLILSWEPDIEHSGLPGKMHYSFLHMPFFGWMEILGRFMPSNLSGFSARWGSTECYQDPGMVGKLTHRNDIK